MAIVNDVGNRKEENLSRRPVRIERTIILNKKPKSITGFKPGLLRQKAVALPLAPLRPKLLQSKLILNVQLLDVIK